MQVLTTDEAALQQLTDPMVRDLGWACFSRALLVHTESIASGRITDHLQSMFELTSQRWQNLQNLNKNPEKLQTFLASKTGRRRLGIYFEHLVEFFLLNDPDIELLVRNLPVRDDHRTLGEFDFIYSDRSASNELIHLEIALKFYMGLPDSMQPSPARRWLGPGSHDALEDKIDKMLTHQSKLACSSYGRRALAQNGCPAPHIQRVVIAGELFTPLEEVPLPSSCIAEHHRGEWIRLEQVDDHISSWHKAILLSKSDWLTPLPEGFLLNHGVSTGSLRQQIDEHFAQSQFPVMIEGGNRIGQSLSRTFVVPLSWPGKC